MITILLIDHAIENARSVRELLSGPRINDFKLDRMSSFREIFKGFRSNAHDVCLIDSGFRNGLKLFAQARSVGCTAPIVLVTANDASEVLEATRIGVADCLVRENLSASRIERTVCSVVEQARRACLHVERERRYLALLDNAEAMIYTHDLDGYFTSINRTGERLTGYSQQEILRANVSHLVTPKYRTLLRKMIERTLDAQVQMVEQLEFLTKEGREITVAAGVHPIYQQGKAIEIQGIATTRSELPARGPRAVRDLFERGPEDALRRKEKAYSFTVPTLRQISPSGQA
jgi:PAS domain S-box-containing protein